MMQGLEAQTFQPDFRDSENQSSASKLPKASWEPSYILYFFFAQICFLSLPYTETDLCLIIEKQIIDNARLTIQEVPIDGYKTVYSGRS